MVKQTWLATTMLLLNVGLCWADNYQNGCTAPAGAGYGNYVYQNGYWYYGGIPYTRTWISTSYYSNGYHYPSGYYQYARYYAPTYYPSSAPAVPVQQPYESEEAFFQRIISEREKTARFGQKLAQLGYPPQQAASYGLPPGYSISGYAYNHQIPVTGATIYGPSQYTYNAQRYTSLDVLSLYQMAHQQTQLAISSGKEATIGFRDIMAPVVDASARVTVQDAKVTNAIRLLHAVDPPTADLKGYQFKAGPAIPAAPNLPPKADNPNAAAQELVDRLEQVMVKSNCAQCHGGKDPKGNLNIADYLDPAKVELRARVMNRISMQPSDPDYATKMMPRAMSGGPGVRLTAEEIAIFDAVRRLVESQPVPMQPGGVPNSVRDLRGNER